MLNATNATQAAASFVVLWGGIYADTKGDDGLPFSSFDEAEEFAKTAVMELGPDETAYYEIVTA